MIATTNSSAQTLSTQFSALSQEVMEFVANCSTEDWQKITAEEQWPIGVTTRHIATGHFGLLSFIRRIVDGEPMPSLTVDTIHEANAQHAAEHANCTQNEVTEILQTNTTAVLDYLGKRSDEELARSAYFRLFGSEISAEKLFAAFFIIPVQEHMTSLKATIAR